MADGPLQPGINDMRQNRNINGDFFGLFPGDSALI